jgi:hypothetical protein
MSADGMDATRRGVYVDAMEKTGSPYDSLVDVRQTSISYPPLPLYYLLWKRPRLNRRLSRQTVRRRYCEPQGEVRRRGK